MDTLGSLLVWAVFGFVVGWIARMLYPGRQSMGLLTTMLLGIAGSFMGGFISWVVNGARGPFVLQGSGWFMSIVGALLVVWLSMNLSNRRFAN